LALAWVVLRGKKGHFPDDVPCTLVAPVQQIRPEGATVCLLADGEFERTALQSDLRQYRWQYVCPTASNILSSACAVRFPVAGLGPARGELLAVSPAWMTEQQYGPISLLAIWEQHYDEAL
jgi:hypothetical protein